MGSGSNDVRPIAQHRWEPSFFGIVDERSVRRRPSDVVQLILAITLIVACFVLTDGFTARDDPLYRALSDLPNWIGNVATGVFLACTIGAVLVIVLALVVSRNFRLAGILVAVGAITGAAAIAIAGAIDVDAVRRAAGPDNSSLSATSVTWLAVATAMLLSAAPYLVRPARRFVRATQVLALVAAVLALIGPLPSILVAYGAGWAISAAACLAIGTPKATPTVPSVEAALHEFGVAIEQLALADVQSFAETRFVGRASDGSPASVVVIGRDAADARLLNKVGRSVLYRDAGPSVSVSRSAQLEHRAYLLLMAARARVAVSDVVVAVRGGTEDMAMLVLIEPAGIPLAAIDPDHITDEILGDVWANVSRLHEAGLTHGQVVPANVVVLPDDSTALVDFSRGSAGAPIERRQFDVADLLATTASIVGVDRSLAAAQRSIGDDRLVELLALLETAALSPAARRAVPDSSKALKELRVAGAALAGCEVPELTPLRRVSIGSVLMAAATFLGFYLIVAQFAGVDLWSTLSEADLAWVLAAFVVSFVPQFSGSIALMGCVRQPLPFRPVLAEQFANNFTGLIGGTVATTALVIRFFQKQGLKVAVAVSSGVMNSLANAMVQTVLVIIAVVVTGAQFTPSSAGGESSGNLERLILIGIIVIGIAVTIAVLVPRLRATVGRLIGPHVEVARENLSGILTNPRKAAMIFGGNLCSQVAYALVIEASLHAYGTSLPLMQIILINSLASLVGGMAPIPGGMGVIEAGLIAGMTAAGVDQSVAVAATFTARLFTAYLPPIWGWFSLRWLRSNDYV